MLMLIFSLSLALSPRANAGTLRYKPEYFDKILVEAEVGKIKIEGNGDGVIETRQGPLWKDSSCELYSELDDRLLKIKLGIKDDERERVTRVTCEALVVIRIPSGKNIEIKADESDISINAMRGKAEVRLKKGELNIDSDLVEMEVRGEAVTFTSSGSITKMKIEFDQKNLNLEMKRLGSSPLRKVTLDITALKTEVVLPFQAKVKTHLSGDGIQARVKSDFPDPTDEDQLDFDLKINSDSGQVGIKKI